MAHIDGYHHVTMSVDGAQEDFDFFTKTLGMKSVKKTVLFDGTTPVYHLYYGNEAGDPSTIVTTFPFRKPGVFGKRGTNQSKVIQLSVPKGSLDFWEDRLNAAGRKATRISRFGLDRVAFEHPCGISHELVAAENDDREPIQADDAADLGEVRRRAVAGDGVELVEGAAGVAEAAAGDHRHVAAAGGDSQRQQQRDGVADAAGRVLVEDGAGQRGPVEHGAGIAHGERHGDALVEAELAEVDRHGEGGDLALADRAVGDAADEGGYLALLDRGAVALAADGLLREEVCHRRFLSSRRRASAPPCRRARR